VRDLRDFVAESNLIEGIGLVMQREVEAHETLLALEELTIEHLEIFVAHVQPGAKLRRRAGLDVRVGPHVPPPGGPEIEEELVELLAELHHAMPWENHVAYETLHPFTDGNGRSGRAIWAWQMAREGRDPFALPFLHRVYYDALDHGQRGL
jgi:hypothetical protein